MGNYTILQMFENPRRGRQARNFTANVPKILDLKSSSEQIFSENCRWVPLITVLIEVPEETRFSLFKSVNRRILSRETVATPQFLVSLGKVTLICLYSYLRALSTYSSNVELHIRQPQLKPGSIFLSLYTIRKQA